MTSASRVCAALKSNDDISDIVTVIVQTMTLNFK